VIFIVNFESLCFNLFFATRYSLILTLYRSYIVIDDIMIPYPPAYTYLGVFGSGSVACMFNLLSYLQVQLMGAFFTNVVNLLLRTPGTIVLSVRGESLRGSRKVAGVERKIIPVRTA
jgi:hypothetical protein